MRKLSPESFSDPHGHITGVQSWFQIPSYEAQCSFPGLPIAPDSWWIKSSFLLTGPAQFISVPSRRAVYENCYSTQKSSIIEGFSRWTEITPNTRKHGAVQGTEARVFLAAPHPVPGRLSSWVARYPITDLPLKSSPEQPNTSWFCSSLQGWSLPFSINNLEC